MKRIIVWIFLPLVILCLGLAAHAGETKPAEITTDAEPLIIAEVQDGVLVPLLNEDELKVLLEDAFLVSGDRELHVLFEKVWFEKHGEDHYLMTVAENLDGEKLSSAIKLEASQVTASTSVVGITPIAIIPVCKSISCTNDPCPMRVWEDHIECYCIAAGDCELKWRIIFADAATTMGL